MQATEVMRLMLPIIFIILPVGIVIVVALWKIYIKLGKPGWVTFIPIYNMLIMLRATGRPGWWLFMFFMPVVQFVFVIALCTGIARSFGKGIGFGYGLLFLNPIFLLILAFGSAEYEGPIGGPAAQSATEWANAKLRS